jgi:hypothetical protein
MKMINKSTKDTVVHLFKEMFPGFSDAYYEQVYDRFVLTKGVHFVQGEPVIPEVEGMDPSQLSVRMDLSDYGHISCRYP